MAQVGHWFEPDPSVTPETLASVPAAIPRRSCACGCGVELTGRQKRFASRLCSSRWWDGQHPRVNVRMEPRAGTIQSLILGAMVAGEWMTAHQIAEAVHAFPHSVSARLSELRRKGHNIESDAVNGNSRRAHRFRLVVR